MRTEKEERKERVGSRCVALAEADWSRCVCAASSQPRAPHQSSQDIYAVNAICFHKPFGTFCTAGSDGTFNFWDKDAKQRLKQFQKLPVRSHNGELWRASPLPRPASLSEVSQRYSLSQIAASSRRRGVDLRREERPRIGRGRLWTEDGAGAGENEVEAREDGAGAREYGPGATEDGAPGSGAARLLVPRHACALAANCNAPPHTSQNSITAVDFNYTGDVFAYAVGYDWSSSPSAPPHLLPACGVSCARACLPVSCGRAHPAYLPLVWLNACTQAPARHHAG